MKNRAKCKLCGDIIESFYDDDYCACKCGEIAVDGGQSMRCLARNWENFLRVDEEGKEYPVKVQQNGDVTKSNKDNVTNSNNDYPSKKELIDMLREMTNSYERLPPEAMSSFITHADFYSLLLLLTAILDVE